MGEIVLQVKPVAGQIQTNFNEIEKQLVIKMSQYDNVVFTEDTKAGAKKTVAGLRKLKKSIEDSDKEVKAQWMEPYNQFHARVKQMTALVDKPINHINGQIEVFEDKRIKERQAEIEKIYMEEIGDMADFLPLYRLQEDKWSNASVSVKSIRKAISEAIAGARAGKAAIEAMQSDAVPDALRKFQATLSLPDALAYKDEIRSVDEESAAPLTAPDSHTAVYTVVGTDSELQELEMAMISLGLYYERKDV